MMNVTRLITRAYAALIRLYPPSFRNQFGDEMQTTFAAAVVQAAENGSTSLFALCWRELVHLPANLLREHLFVHHKEDYPMMSKKRVLIPTLAMVVLLAAVLVVAPWQREPKVAVKGVTPEGTTASKGARYKIVFPEQHGRYAKRPSYRMTAYVVEIDGETPYGWKARPDQMEVTIQVQEAE